MVLEKKNGEKIRGKIEEIKQWGVLVIFTLILLAVYMGIHPDHGDDLIYARIYDPHGLFAFLRERYMIWSSRVVIEAVMLPVAAAGEWVWRGINICMILVLTVNVAELFGVGDRNGKVGAQILFFGLFFLIPAEELSNAGWIATTTNYLWPLALGMVALRPLNRMLKGEKCRRWECVVCPLCVLYAANMEQMCAILLGTYIVTGSYLYLVKKERPGRFFAGMLFLIAAMMVFILAAPGNAVRTAAETKTYFPEYGSISMAGRLCMGIIECGHYFLAAGNEQNVYAFAVLSGVLFLCAVVGEKRKGKGWNYPAKVAVSFFPFLFYMLFGQVLKTLAHEEKITRGLRVIGALGDNRYLPQTGSFQAEWVVFQITAYLCVFVCTALSVYLLHGKSEETLLQLIILAAGLASKVIIGFSPTVYASGQRTALFSSAAFLILTVRNLQLCFKNFCVPGTERRIFT